MVGIDHISGKVPIRLDIGRATENFKVIRGEGGIGSGGFRRRFLRYNQELEKNAINFGMILVGYKANFQHPERSTLGKIEARIKAPGEL